MMTRKADSSMMRIFRLLFLAPIFASSLVMIVASSSARAQDDDIIVDDEQVLRGEVVNRVMYTDENFDQWVFGGRNLSAIRSHLDSLLALQIEAADRACKLSDAQKAKLKLAGKGDVKHFFDRVAEKKRQFQLVKNDQNKIGEIFNEIQPLQLTLNSGPYDDGSIFFKTIRKTLDASQVDGYENVVRERLRFRYRAKVELVVATLDQALGLRGEQRKKMVDLILAETKPPKRYGQYDYYLVMYQLSKIPEAKMKPLLDAAQWKVLQAQLQQGRGMEDFLRQNGFLLEGDKPAKDEKFRKPAEVFVTPLAK